MVLFLVRFECRGKREREKKNGGIYVYVHPLNSSRYINYRLRKMLVKTFEITLRKCSLGSISLRIKVIRGGGEEKSMGENLALIISLIYLAKNFT